MTNNPIRTRNGYTLNKKGEGEFMVEVPANNPSPIPYDDKGVAVRYPDHSERIEVPTVLAQDLLDVAFDQQDVLHGIDRVMQEQQEILLDQQVQIAQDAAHWGVRVDETIFLCNSAKKASELFKDFTEAGKGPQMVHRSWVVIK